MVNRITDAEWNTLLTALQVTGDFEQVVTRAFLAGQADLQRVTTASGGEPVRDPALEAAIAEAPGDRAAASVYADWLMERGQLHGELIAAAIAAEVGGRPRRTWTPLLHRLAREQFPWLSVPDRLLAPHSVEWRSGLIRALRIPRDARVEGWVALLGSTMGIGIEALALMLGGALGTSHLPALPALRHLYLRLDHGTAEVDLSLLARHPRLERLGLENRGYPSMPWSLADIGALPALERLDLHSAGFEHLEALHRATRLETLAVLPGPHQPIDLRPLRGLASLRVLAVDGIAPAGLLALLDELPGLRTFALDLDAPPGRTNRRQLLMERLEARGVEVVDIRPYLPRAGGVVP